MANYSLSKVTNNNLKSRLCHALRTSKSRLCSVIESLWDTKNTQIFMIKCKNLSNGL